MKVKYTTSNGNEIIAFADIEEKRFEYVGDMWGTKAMYLDSNGDISAAVDGDQLNQYHYADGAISLISAADFEVFKQEQRRRVELEEASLSEAQAWVEEAWAKDENVAAEIAGETAAAVQRLWEAREREQNTVSEDSPEDLLPDDTVEGDDDSQK